MKAILLMFISTCCFCLVARTQFVNQKSVEVFKYNVDSCLFKLFTSIVKSNKKSKRGSEYFYSVTYRIGKELRYLHVKPEMKSHSEFLDYSGIMQIKNRTFLFRGDLESDPLFERIGGSPVSVKLTKSQMDSLTMKFFSEPSLQGVYNSCDGMPIYIEVYTDNKIKGFDMKLPN